ncbi:hypothetical protein GCM10023188_25230 [Pontibacter saemangeumensis]|uniref:Uncharacterized protein n=1 Tax=Pontibacter saemangeumensis TaxID=1084525 RepID=A0ABP8LTX5_9BACT
MQAPHFSEVKNSDRRFLSRGGRHPPPAGPVCGLPADETLPDKNFLIYVITITAEALTDKKHGDKERRKSR